jgi:hypothetical protein
MDLVPIKYFLELFQNILIPLFNWSAAVAQLVKHSNTDHEIKGNPSCRSAPLENGVEI